MEFSLPKSKGDNLRSISETSMGIELFQGAHFIYLYREDLLAQAVSFHVSLLTGRWGPDSTVSTNPVPHPQFFDNTLIENRMQILADQDREWRLFFARNTISQLTFSYEAIRDDIAGALRKIVKSFAIHLPSCEFEYVEALQTETGAPGEPTKSDIKKRFMPVNKLVVAAPLHDITQAPGREAFP